MKIKPNSLITGYIFIVLIVGYFCFAPGLTHVFILDDFNTLSPLADFGSRMSVDEIKAYVFSGSTGPTGRPISLFSFVLNSGSWPDKPGSFIAVNIFIHLANGLLVFVFLRCLLDYVGITKKQSIFTAFFVFLIWVLHPFHVSSVLYVVQRMTLLSTFFTLLTFIIFLKLRFHLERKENIASIVLLFFAGAGCSLLALMSKENAVLIPIQLAIIELYLLLSGVRFNSNKVIKLGFYFTLIFFSAVYVLYLLSLPFKDYMEYLRSGVIPMHNRTFSMLERVLTEQRIVGDYVLDTLFPKMQNAGVFYDNYKVSTSLFSPFSTVVWFLIHLCTVFTVFFYRKKIPLIFLGLTFFYISHSLESSFLMLELKFDHRNYLPSLGLILALVGAVDLTFRSVNWSSYFLLIILAIVNACFLFSASSLWGQPEKASVIWAKKNPLSIRALEHAATIQYNYGRVDETLEYLRKSIILSGGAPTSELKYMVTACHSYDGADIDWLRFAERIKTEDRNWALDAVLNTLLDVEIKNKCFGFGFSEYQSLLQAYRENGAYAKLFTSVLLDVSEIKAAYYFERADLVEGLVNLRDITKVPLAFEMLKAGVVASNGGLSLAEARLKAAIAVAESDQGYYAEDEFNISSAKEMLKLINNQIEEKEGQ